MVNGHQQKDSDQHFPRSNCYSSTQSDYPPMSSQQAGQSQASYPQQRNYTDFADTICKVPPPVSQYNTECANHVSKAGNPELYQQSHQSWSLPKSQFVPDHGPPPVHSLSHFPVLGDQQNNQRPPSLVKDQMQRHSALFRPDNHQKTSAGNSAGSSDGVTVPSQQTMGSPSVPAPMDINQCIQWLNVLTSHMLNSGHSQRVQLGMHYAQ